MSNQETTDLVQAFRQTCDALAVVEEQLHQRIDQLETSVDHALTHLRNEMRDTVALTKEALDRLSDLAHEPGRPGDPTA